MLDSDGNILRMSSQKLAKYMCSQLTIFATYLGKDAESQQKVEDAEKALAQICAEAYHLAMLFHRTKTEYRWRQEARLAEKTKFEEDQYEILGSEGGRDGPKTLQEARKFLMVFGGVLKGAGDSKRIKEDYVHLFKSHLLLL